MFFLLNKRNKNYESLNDDEDGQDEVDLGIGGGSNSGDVETQQQIIRRRVQMRMM